MPYDSSKAMMKKTLFERVDMVLEIMSSKHQTDRTKKSVVASCAAWPFIYAVSEQAYNEIKSKWPTLLKYDNDHKIECREARLAGLVFEHTIPVKVMYDWIKDNNPPADRLAAVLSDFRLAIITEAEDRKLNAAGLRQKMPADWTMDKSPFCRYRAVGIDMHWM